MAASALKMATIGAVLIILLSSAGQPAMAYVDGVACPSGATPCRAECISACGTVTPMMCNMLCTVTPPVLGVVDQACMDHFFPNCMAACKTMCEPVQTP